MKFASADSGLFLYGMPLLLALGFGLYLFLRIRFRHSPIRPFVPGVLFKFMALAFLIVAVLQPFYETKIRSAGALAVLDISDSMEAGPVEDLLKRLPDFRSKGMQIEFLPFAGEASPTVLEYAQGGSLEKIRSAWQGLNTGATSLERALLELSRYENASALLISDGRETSGEMQNALARLQAQGVRVFPLIPREDSAPEGVFQVSHLYAPLVAPAQKSVDIRVTLRNTTSIPCKGRLQIKHGGKPVLEKIVEVAAGGSVLELTQSDPSAEGIREIEAVLTPEDSKIETSSRKAYLSTESREKVLLLSGASEDERLLSQALKEQAYQLKALTADGRFTTLPDFGDFSVVIFNNVSLGQLTPGSDRLLQSYVKNGGGFVMLGGNKSFGLGGYKDTVIEDVLPVRLMPPQSAKKRLNLAVELVLDKSRSMGESSKIDFAKEAAREVIRTVKDEDYVGVIGFDSVPFEVVKLDLAGKIRDEAISRVGRLFATGKTMLLPAMEEARRRLNSAAAGRKHMIILTDGQIEDAGTYYLEMVKQMRIVGITVSTVMVGGASDMGFLQSLAEAGGGAYYETSDPRALPRIFISDVKVASGERTMKEQDEFMVRPGPDEIQSTSIRQFPPLRGYVETARREDARLELVVQAQEKNDPLLASWQYGSGKSAAFTSDANGRWSSFWAGWSGYVRFWSEVTDSLRAEHKTSDEPEKFDLRYYFDKGRLSLDLSVFSEEAAKNVSATLIFPDGSEREVAFGRESSGHYQAQMDRIIPGRYEFRGTAGGRKLTAVAFNLSSEFFGERKGLGFDTAVLYQLAAATGGKVNPSLKDLDGEYSVRVDRVDLTRLFLLLSLICFCAEIFKREVRRPRRQREIKSTN